MKINLVQSSVLAVALLALPVAAQAQFIYTTNNGTITITGYTGSGGAVNIPAQINGLPVTSIGASAFADQLSITGVTIPNSVTSIGLFSFAACVNLTTITVDAQNSAYSSVNGVLFDKSQTTLVVFPGGKTGSYVILNSVTSIGSGAFSYCTSLTNITIPNSVTSIEGWAFAGCTSLTNITIPNSIISIGGGAFQGCYSFTSVSIPEGVTSIGDSAFEGCFSLTSVTIPSSVTSIGNQAFASCYSLSSVTIPESVTSIGESVTSIGDYAFSYCISLASVTIGNGVTNIGSYAFSGCSSLTSVTIPGSVTSIGDRVFWGCTSLIAITVDAQNSFYSSVNGVLFDKSQTTLVKFPGGLGGSYTIPNSVTSIGDTAFAQCYSLTSVTIPASVTNIGNEAFFGCGSLTSAYFEDNAPTFGWQVFGVWSDMGIPVDPVTVYYLPGATGWDLILLNVPSALWLPQVQTGDASFGVRTNQFGFNIAWASGQTVVVEASTSLTNPAWQPIQTNTLASDSVHFSDPQWTNFPARFYRLRSP